MHLGKEGLEKAQREIEEAISNQVLPPKEVLASVPLGDAGKIVFRYKIIQTL